MEKLVLPFEMKPYVLTQGWGVLRPEVYAQFGFSRHNGQDVALGEGKELRAPFDFEVTQVLWQPNGGGHVVGIVSRKEYDGPGGPCNVQIDFMHLERVLVKPGYRGTIGEVVAIGDNTGFSTGPHCHIRHKWVRRKGSRLVDAEKNDAQNSFDPTPYRNGDYAKDIYFLTRKLSLLRQIVELYKRMKGV